MSKSSLKNPIDGNKCRLVRVTQTIKNDYLILDTSVKIFPSKNLLFLFVVRFNKAKHCVGGIVQMTRVFLASRQTLITSKAGGCLQRLMKRPITLVKKNNKRMEIC